ncbi:hypothetical protein MRB53_039513 [Persea americana]|nr:hypothetical protein MRB53_039513 [Persea americana]
MMRSMALVDLVVSMMIEMALSMRFEWLSVRLDNDDDSVVLSSSRGPTSPDIVIITSRQVVAQDRPETISERYVPYCFKLNLRTARRACKNPIFLNATFLIITRNSAVRHVVKAAEVFQLDGPYLHLENSGLRIGCVSDTRNALASEFS